jgi:large subunit ribosomal protein L4
MPETDLINIKGEKTGLFQLDEKVFNAKVNPALVHEVLIAQLAARRQGSANTKTRGEVSGGGVKPWRQKGTGRARVGSTRSPLWRHGGTTFGPKPRSFETALPKKKRKIALKYVLTSKLREGNLKIVDVLELKEPKTRLAVQFLKDIKVAGHKTLVVVKEENVNLDRAFSNIADVKLILVRNLNVHDLINYEITLITQDAANALKEVAQ